jgi:hypothetical protein
VEQREIVIEADIAGRRQQIIACEAEIAAEQNREDRKSRKKEDGWRNECETPPPSVEDESWRVRARKTCPPQFARPRRLRPFRRFQFC